MKEGARSVMAKRNQIFIVFMITLMSLLFGTAVYAYNISPETGERADENYNSGTGYFWLHINNAATNENEFICVRASVDNLNCNESKKVTYWIDGFYKKRDLSSIKLDDKFDVHLLYPDGSVDVENQGVEWDVLCDRDGNIESDGTIYAILPFGILANTNTGFTWIPDYSVSDVQAENADLKFSTLKYGDPNKFYCEIDTNNVGLTMWGLYDGVPQSRMKHCVIGVKQAHTNYIVHYDALDGALLDENDNLASTDEQGCEYDSIYKFFGAFRSYKVQYDLNDAVASPAECDKSQDDAVSKFNGWNESLDSGTSHGMIDKSYDYSTNTWNWAAYLNYGNRLSENGYLYDFVYAIRKYRVEGGAFSNVGYLNNKLGFKNLSNGGKLYMSANYTPTSIVLPETTRTGYSFKGWKNESGSIYAAGEEYTPLKNETLTAVWEKTPAAPDKPKTKNIVVNHYVMDLTGTYQETPEVTYTVNYELGTEVTINDLISQDILGTEGINYDHATVIEKLDMNGTNDISENVCTECVVNSRTESINLYYAREVHTVTYDVATNLGTWLDGNVQNKTVKVYTGAEIDLTPKAVKKDWNFAGWNTDKNQKNGISTIMKMGTQDITLYALYNHQFSVTFVDCSGSRIVSTNVSNDSSQYIDALKITPYEDWKNVSEKKIIGWSRQKNVEEETGSGKVKYDLQSGQKKVEVTENVTYYAIYQATAELKYDLQGGNVSDSTAPVNVIVYRNAYDLTNTIGKEITLPSATRDNIEKDGYIHVYSLTGWAENGLNGQLYSVSGKYVISQNTTMYAIWDDASHGISYTIRFDPNGGTGNMDNIEAIFDTELILPESKFKRKTDWGNSKFLGWNVNPNTKEIQYSDQETVLNLADRDGAVVTLYAIWDDCPEIEAVDRYYTLDQAQAGLITAADLLTTASATDDIDGVITDGLTVKNYSPNEFTQFQSDGTATVTYQAQDSGGNKSTKTVTVYITDTKTVVIKDNKYVRFISEKYYQNAPEDGGLELNSKWRNNPEYAAVLEAAMTNRISLTEETASMSALGYTYTVKKPGSVSRDHTYQTWKFTHDDVLRAKQYIQDNGVGNFQSDTALAGFYNEFSSCLQ